ncbi:hypothetical protein [Dechloromonas sp. HYN0024]|uniref:hypothetical protein n=1 Tax=Dechloromonas sp. HYN0024 TaxID=2231055 RepID=UPI000E4316B2|nr:hypothetical protein [Dechloromonas sp. HYN0024]AXS80156.1 hypothetical protein HYN24_09060 [Dechloromonas sp. HYN0024]
MDFNSKFAVELTFFSGIGEEFRAEIWGDIRHVRFEIRMLIDKTADVTKTEPRIWVVNFAVLDTRNSLPTLAN